jgi:hypothetical protein
MPMKRRVSVIIAGLLLLVSALFAQQQQGRPKLYSLVVQGVV